MSGPWRRVTDERDPRAFASWVRGLRGQSGVYLIRAAVSGLVGDKPARRGELLYIGESHRGGALYTTFTRHFQRAGARCYDRARVEARVILLEGAKARIEEHRQIQRLAPRDNLRATLPGSVSSPVASDARIVVELGGPLDRRDLEIRFRLFPAREGRPMRAAQFSRAKTGARRAP
jgi:hypothetical protein